MSNNYNPPFQGAGHATPNGARANQRHSGDFRGGVPGGNSNGNAPVPVPTAGHRMNGQGSRSGFEGPRSPPNKQSTSHVPCKFFRQGACQAGKACPFMHTTEPITEAAPCKYFQKGNCKFGAKCALAHILPDGRRVNRTAHMGGGLNLGGRMNVPHTEPIPVNSLLSMQMPGQPQPGFGAPEDYFQSSQAVRPNYDGIPTIDTTFSSHPGSNYGSPPNENRIVVSPIQKGLTVMDVPLPASFDSQGISHIARYGPIASSVPGRFDPESSPPSSVPKATDSHTLRNLHVSAFGEGSPAIKNGFGSSPPQQDGFLGRRILHSDRPTRTGMMSSSLDVRKKGLSDWDLHEDNFTYDDEADYVPNSLNELLTPQEKMRRFSRTEEEHPFRQSLSGLGTPTDSNSKVGSPKVGSPSRYSAIFARQKNEEGAQAASPSAFGHVGSPLRNSSLHPGASPSLRAVRQPTSGDVTPYVSSPPRQASMSMISQQLSRSRISNRQNVNDSEVPSQSSNSLHPGMARAASGSSIGSAPGRTSLDRAISSGSIGRGDRIEEEEQGLFRMEDEEEIGKRGGGFGAITPTGNSATNKRFSGGWGNLSGLGATKKDTNTLGTSPGSLSGGPGTIGDLRKQG